jgi:4-hydroxy-3-polyprenylbenzoate decarboxylase
MSNVTLADLLDDLERDGQLVRVHAEVDPLLEIAEITRRVAGEGGPALLFSQVQGHDTPLVTNLWGTPHRLCRALGIDTLEQLAGRAFPPPVESTGGLLERMNPWSAGEEKFSPKTLKVAPCQQIVHLGSDVDLKKLPVLQSGSAETGRCITAGVTVAQSADSDRAAISRNDLTILDENRLAIAWPPDDPLAEFLEEHARREENMPVAIVLGAEASIALAAAMPVSPGDDPWQFIGRLRDDPLSLVKCRTHGLRVPAEAELVIEGTIDPAEETIVGPSVAGANGFYSASVPARVIHVEAMTCRSDWTFPAIVLGPPPHELSVLAKAIERMLLPLAKAAADELVDLALPDFGGGQLVLASIRKSLPHQAEKVAGTLWGLDWLMRCKMMVIVDEHVDVQEPREVLRRAVANVLPSRDVHIRNGPSDPLDHATPVHCRGNKLLFDATAKLPAEHEGSWPEEIATTRETADLVRSRWKEYGLGGG